MSTPQGCTDDSDVVEQFKEALKQRIGQERFQIWFSEVRFLFSPADAPPQISNGQNPGGAGSVVLLTHGQFAADRLVKHYMAPLRGAAAASMGSGTKIEIRVEQSPAEQCELPFAGSESPAPDPTAKPTNNDPPQARRPVPQTNPASRPRRRNVQSLSVILRDGTDSRKRQRSGNRQQTETTPLLDHAIQSSGKADSAQRDSKSELAKPPATQSSPGSGRGSELTWEQFVGGQCNELARTACKMAIESPGVASPLVLWGPAGSGKSHLLNAVATKLRRVHRMRRVMYLGAEEFTNDFIKALNGNCLPAFRSRFRDADALLIDDIQFFVEKKATIRELHHTIEMLAEYGKPLIFAGTKAPSEINGLGGELSGRLASGLVCQVESLDSDTRIELIRRYSTERCPIPWPDSTITEVATVAEGDGRLLSGIVNLVSLLQRMEGKMPSMDQIRQHGSHLLRKAGVPITLSAIERAVEKVFQLDAKSLQSSSQTKSITEPRMLAMYLSREMTSSAFSEIGGHFGGRSHSTAILANQRVRQWLDAGRSIGRGKSSLATDEAIRRIESVLKTG